MTRVQPARRRRLAKVIAVCLLLAVVGGIGITWFIDEWLDYMHRPSHRTQELIDRRMEELEAERMSAAASEQKDAKAP